MSTCEPGDWIAAQPTGEGRFQTRVTVRETTILADEPVSVGGLAAGPSPYELLSAALAACTTMTVRLYASQKGWPLDDIHVRVCHSKDAALTPPDLFSREITLAGPLDAGQRERLMAIAERCPVHQTLTRGVRVETREAGLPPPLTEPEPAEQHGLDVIDIGEGAD